MLNVVSLVVLSLALGSVLCFTRNRRAAETEEDFARRTISPSQAQIPWNTDLDIFYSHTPSVDEALKNALITETNADGSVPLVGDLLESTSNSPLNVFQSLVGGLPFVSGAPSDVLGDV
ncbi:hypothetical protein BgiBS90_026222 [Biomphalaria glabrata]|nr:hypothetical protein BgiBS90_026222 [Biomphalaria glabrata]